MPSPKTADIAPAELAKTPLPAADRLGPVTYDVKEIARLASLFKKPCADVLDTYSGIKIYSRMQEEEDLRILAIGEQYGIQREAHFLPLPPMSFSEPQPWINSTPPEARKLILALAKESKKWGKTFAREDEVTRRGGVAGGGSDPNVEAGRKQAYEVAQTYRAINGCGAEDAKRYLAESGLKSSWYNTGAKLLDPDNVGALCPVMFLLRHYRTMSPLQAMAYFPPDAPLTIVNRKQLDDYSALGHAAFEAVEGNGGMVERLASDELPGPQLKALQAAISETAKSFTIFDYTTGNGGQADTLRTALQEDPLRLDAPIIRPDTQRLAAFLERLDAIAAALKDTAARYLEKTGRSAPANQRGVAGELRHAISELQDAMPCADLLRQAKALEARTAMPTESEVQGCIGRCRTAAVHYSAFWDGRAPGLYLLAHQCRPPRHILEWDRPAPPYQWREKSAQMQLADLLAEREEAERVQREKESAELLRRASQPLDLTLSAFGGAGILGSLGSVLAPANEGEGL